MLLTGIALFLFWPMDKHHSLTHLHITGMSKKTHPRTTTRSTPSGTRHSSLAAVISLASTSPSRKRLVWYHCEFIFQCLLLIYILNILLSLSSNWITYSLYLVGKSQVLRRIARGPPHRPAEGRRGTAQKAWIRERAQHKVRRAPLVSEGWFALIIYIKHWS